MYFAVSPLFTMFLRPQKVIDIDENGHVIL